MTRNTEAVADRLHSAMIRSLRRLRRVDESAGLTAPKLSALSVLVFAGPMTLGRLAAVEQMRPASMSRTVADLEAAGLVKRIIGREDRRERVIAATARGQAVMNRGRGMRVRLLAQWMEGLSERDIRVLDRAGEILIDLGTGQDASH